MIILSWAAAQDKPDPRFELYILIGQSNMAGRGPITGDLINQGDDSVFMFNKEMKWVPARHPLHFDKPAFAGAGPGLQFGMEMARSRNVRVGLIPCAVGGTPIEHWTPGAYDSATKTHPYDDAAARIKEAMLYGEIKGVIWHQGEANSKPEQVEKYITQLIELINRVRNVVNNPRLPFVAGELGRFYSDRQYFNPQIHTLPAKVPFTAVVSSKGLTHKGDSLHFDGNSANKLGQRYAKAMLKLRKKAERKK